MTLPLHLSKKDKINLGSFYTADFLVNEVFAMLRKYVDYKGCVLLDSSCGSGNFLRAEAINKGGFSKDFSKNHIGASYCEYLQQRAVLQVFLYISIQTVEIYKQMLAISKCG